MRILLPNASLVIIIIISSSSNSSSSGGSGSDSDSTSSFGSCKILTWAGKYKSGVMARTRVGKYNLETRADKEIVFCQGR